MRPLFILNRLNRKLILRPISNHLGNKKGATEVLLLG